MRDHLTKVELLSSINIIPKQGKIESLGLYRILISAIILYKSTLLLFDIKGI